MSIPYQLDHIYRKVIKCSDDEYMKDPYFTGIVEMYEKIRMQDVDVLFLYSIRYYVDGRVHRKNGPAIIWYNGNQYWYKEGLQHRTDGPAVVYGSGEPGIWLLNGEKVPMETVFELMTPEEKEYAIWNYFGM